MKVALHLKDHPDVAWVRYPGLPDDPQYKKTQKYLKGSGEFAEVFPQLVSQVFNTHSSLCLPTPIPFRRSNGCVRYQI